MKKVVIVGGGFCGLLVAKKLEGRFAVTLIDKKSYFEYTPSILKTIDGDVKKYRIEFSSILKKSQIIVKAASVKIQNQRPEILVGKKSIPYDYGVLSTGFVPFMPFRGAKVFDACSGESILAAKEALASAKTVAIIGGGYIGVEFAAEIATKLPQKKIIILHSSPRLLDRDAEKVSSYALKFLRKKGVDVRLSTKVTRVDRNKVIGGEGKPIEADIIFSCLGTRPSTGMIDHSLLNERKEVKVHPTLQLDGHDSIFAGGDIISIREERTAQNAEGHAKVIADNIIRLESGKSLRQYMPSQRAMVISLGDGCGILAKNRFILTGFIPGKLKHIIEKKVTREYA